MHQHFGVADIPFSFLNSMTWLKTIEAIVSATGGKKKKQKKISWLGESQFQVSISKVIWLIFSDIWVSKLTFWDTKIKALRHWPEILASGWQDFLLCLFFFFFSKFRGGNKLPQKTALKRTAVEILSSGGRCCHYVGHKRFIVGHVVLHTNYGNFIAFNFLWATWNNLAGGIHLVFGWVVRCRISEEEWVGNSCVISREHLDT